MKNLLTLLATASLLFVFLTVPFQPEARTQDILTGTARVWSEPWTEAPDRVVDIQHMRLEVSFDTSTGRVRGRVTHVFRPLRQRVDSIFFHAVDIRFHSTLLNGHPARTTVTESGISVFCDPPLRWEETDSVTFEYDAQPRRGIYFVGWNDPTGRSRRQIWTQGQGIDNRHWIPCYDLQHDKLTTETIITFDSSYRVISNGTLLATRDNPGGTRTWHYRLSRPHTTYLVMIGIGDYAVQTRRTSRGIPVHLWYYPDMPDRVNPTYLYSAECVDFMEEHTGVPYPWESYANFPVQDFLYGAMENTTVTVFGDFFLVDARSFHDQNYIAVNVHELAHQWFGDFVTGRSGRDAWLQEGFSTWYPKLFFRKVEGEDSYQWRRRREHLAALQASKSDQYPILHSKAGGDRVYDKASAVLDMMVRVFGEEEVRRVVLSYLTRHAYGNAESVDFERAFQEVLGISPRWFFDQWIYRGGEPHYRISYRELTVGPERRKETAVTVRQAQPVGELSGLFRMPVIIEVFYMDGGVDRREYMLERETEQVIVPNTRGREVAFVLFDPGGWILKTVSFPKTFGELRRQALGASLMIDRYDAVAAMDTLEAAVKRDVLIQVYGRERFFALRAEAARQLARDPHPAATNLVSSALGDPSAGVRSAVLTALDTVPAALVPRVEGLLRDSSYAIVDSALKKLAGQFPARVTGYLNIVRNDRGIGNHLLVRRHEIAATHGSAPSLDSLVDLAGPWFEFRTRINALQALRRLNHCPEQLVPHLLDAVAHWNARARAPAAEVARAFLSQTTLRERMRRSYRPDDWRPWQRAILDPLLSASSSLF